jgi:CRISPR-associated endonuclease/helicase Cas3
VREDPCDPRAGLPRTVPVTRLADTAAAVVRIVAAAGAGGAVAWIRNSVDDAIDAVALLQARGIEPLLFHASFGMTDRLKIERIVLSRFGRDSRGDARRCVLVATQVVEQSLDLDFDVMVTDLAPADLLIQRAGRLWRHDRGERCVPGPELLIVSPPPVDDPGEDWIRTSLPRTGSVYRDHALLWRSARELFEVRGAIVTPRDMRPIIEAVANHHAQGAIPAGLVRSDADAHGRALAQGATGQQNVLTLEAGYRADAGLWEPDTATPTRLEDIPHVTLRLALVRDRQVVPYADDPDLRRAWALSEVIAARHRVTACPVPPELQEAHDAARRQWGRWERDSPQILIGILDPDPAGGYRLGAVAEDGEDFTASPAYSANLPE